MKTCLVYLLQIIAPLLGLFAFCLDFGEAELQAFVVLLQP